MKLTEEALTKPIEERAREYLRQCAPQHREREWYRIIAELIMQQHLLMDAVRRYGNSNTNDEIIAAVRQAIAESIERTAP